MDHCNIPVDDFLISTDSFEGSLHADVKKGTTDIFITRPEQIKVESETGKYIGWFNLRYSVQWMIFWKELKYVIIHVIHCSSKCCTFQCA